MSALNQAEQTIGDIEARSRGVGRDQQARLRRELLSALAAITIGRHLRDAQQSAISSTNTAYEDRVDVRREVVLEQVPLLDTIFEICREPHT